MGPENLHRWPKKGPRLQESGAQILRRAQILWLEEIRWWRRQEIGRRRWPQVRWRSQKVKFSLRER